MIELPFCISIILAIALVLFNTKNCIANPILSVLPITPTFKLWSLLLVILIEYIVYYKNINRIKKLELLFSVAFANVVSTILGVIFGGIFYLILDHSNSQKVIHLFEFLITYFSFVFKDRFFWSYFLTSLMWTLFSLILAYFLAVYSEAKVIYWFHSINDESQIIAISYKANTITYILISIYLIINLYYNAISILLE